MADLSDFQDFFKGMGMDEKGNPPPLHADLVPYVYEDSEGWTKLKHPWVFVIPYADHLAGMANRSYEAKQVGIKRALRDGDWHSYIWMHERPYRVDALLSIASKMTDRMFWIYARDVWIDSENIWQNVEEWRSIFTSGRKGRQRFMVASERTALLKMPEVITVYRGTNVLEDECQVLGSGMSWTLDRERAEWFAKRVANEDDNPAVWVGLIRRDKVIGYLTGRSEEEIVALEEDVDIQSLIEIN